jgi:DNA-binding transcriptional MerR regulator
VNGLKLWGFVIVENRLFPSAGDQFLMEPEYPRMQCILQVVIVPCSLIPMPQPHSSTSLPAKALREFEKIAKSDWGDGVPITESLKRINRVAAHLSPEEDDGTSRVKRVFTERSFRHYQTLGCINPPEKDGHQASYQFRHFVQALLVRKLLWERVPSEQIAVLMAGRSTDETERMFLGGIEMVAKAEVGAGALASRSSAPGPAETWKRVQVAPGVELHLREGMPKRKAADLKDLMERIEKALRRGF